MKRIIIIPLAVLFAAMTLTVSCSDYEEGRGTEIESLSFNGTVLDFLDHAEEYSDLTFDSLRLLVNNIPGLRDKFGEKDAEYTLFLAPDRSFTLAMDALNRYRRGHKLGRNIELKDLLIEPFSVTDTIIPGTGVYVEEVFVPDTVYNVRHYDYRASLDTIVCRYAFKQAITSYSANNDTYISIAFRQMKVNAGYNDASGMAGMGTSYMQLVDMQGTMREELWLKTPVIKRDIKCTNGYVHILSDSQEFAFNNIIYYYNNYGNEQNKE